VFNNSSYKNAREKAWKGHTARIREALRECPKSVDELVEELGLERKTVHRFIQQMCTRSGGVMVCPEEPGKYELFRPVPPQREIRLRRGCGSGKIAGPVRIGRGLVWGAGY